MDTFIHVNGVDFHACRLTTPASNVAPKLLFDCLSAGDQILLAGKNVSRVVIVADGVGDIVLNGRYAANLTTDPLLLQIATAESYTFDMHDALQRIKISSLAAAASSCSCQMFFSEQK
ncbi:MAG: hypothetical protein H0X04_00105 [Chthoniobacterales bacterium]|nr:hypothetical protein [Chthoniobacterales bacterium]